MDSTQNGLVLQKVLDRITDAYVALDAEWRYTYVNESAAKLLGRRSAELIGKHVWTEFPEGMGEPFHLAYERAMAEQVPSTVEAYYPPYGRWFESRIYPSPDGLTIYFHDITERRREELFEAGQREILADIAEHRPLEETLTRIARLYEELNPGALCSLLLLDAEGKVARHGAAPSLPDAYNNAIDGFPIGEAHGACGTAMWRGERVVVADIATHPFWEEYKHLALPLGLRACWSTPVLSSGGQTLGSFAVYYKEAREPHRYELESVDRMLSVTAITIESDQMLRRLRERDYFFDMSMEIYCVFDPKTQRITQANAAFSNVTGFSQEELTGRHYLEFVHPDDRGLTMSAVATLNHAGNSVQQVVYRFLCKDGSYRWFSWESVVVPDGLAFSVARDVTDQRDIEAALAHAASHDAVTSLPHHLGLEREMARLLEEAATPVWVLFIGVDRFHAINESMGHGVGDEVLRWLAKRLQQAVGSQGRIARFAGDEFVITVTSLDRSEVIELAEDLRGQVAEPIECGAFRLLLTASVGISHSPDHGRTPQDLLRRAQAAMNRAKRTGRDGICEFSADQMRDIEDRMLLSGRLRGAIARGEMHLHYQPQHRAIDGALTGFEALLRWNSEGLGEVAPARFIPIAEALGLMPEIGAWVVNDACRQARAWLDQGFRDFSIAVNISAQELQRPGLVEHVGDALRRHSLPPDVLNIELTESSLMENIERVTATLAELKSLGTTLSLDDFGTGYSSLAYLKQFPIDKLKIDQSFVRGLPEDGDDAVIARTIVAMAHQLRMVVSAEGVETQAQALFLNGIGCDELQGYYFGRPVASSIAEACFRGDAVVR
jgi:diguanylate cyclase (GGDEF)-like protein/PAS domain S-box-containing protein